MPEEKKTRDPVQDRGIKTKQAILDAALVQFSEKGYHQTNSKEIAKAAGVSTGTFYAYYPDKRALFLDALQVYHLRFNEKLFGYLDGLDLTLPDRRKILRGLVQALIDAHKVYIKFHDELIVMIFSDPEVFELTKAKMIASRGRIRGYLERWKGEIGLSDLDAAAAIIFEMVHSVVDLVIQGRSDIPDGRIIDGLVELLERALFARR